MKKRIKIVLVVATIVALPLMGAGMQQSKSAAKILKEIENLLPKKRYVQLELFDF